jgi:hypothetical protein
MSAISSGVGDGLEESVSSGMATPVVVDIEITIVDGKVKFHIQGIKGSGCSKIAAAIIKAAGGPLIEAHLTAEYDENPIVTARAPGVTIGDRT